MAGSNRGAGKTLVALVLTFLSHLAQSTEVVTGYWSDVSKSDPVIQASLSPKSPQDPSESRLLKFNLAQLRDALNEVATINIMLPSSLCHKPYNPGRELLAHRFDPFGEALSWLHEHHNVDRRVRSLLAASPVQLHCNRAQEVLPWCC